MLGENLRHCREQSHLTPKDLATYLNVSVQSISKWENDACEPSIENLKALSKLYGIRIDNLVGAEKPVLLVSKKKWALNLLVLLLFLVLGFIIEVGKNHYGAVIESKKLMNSWGKQYDMTEVVDTYNEMLTDEKISGYVVFENEYYAIYDKTSKLIRIGILEDYDREKYLVLSLWSEETSNGYIREEYQIYSVYFATIYDKKYIIVDENSVETNTVLGLVSKSTIKAVHADE